MAAGKHKRGGAASTRHLPYDVLLLGQRRRRWPNIKTPLGRHLVFSGGGAEGNIPAMCGGLGDFLGVRLLEMPIIHFTWPPLPGQHP